MIRVIIADDHLIVREGLKRLLAEAADLEVVGEAGTGDEVLEQCSRTPADVLLLDVSMPGAGVLEILRRLRESVPALRILILSVHSEEHYALRTMRAGALGYLMKNQSPDELEEAIRRVHQGRRYLSRTLVEQLAIRVGPNAEKEPIDRLTDREFEVLRHLTSGKSQKEIASNLGLSEKTISTYRSRILEKLDLENTVDLIRYALEHDLEF